MNNKLKILHLEDLGSDAELINKALKKGIPDFERLVVDSKAQFIKALEEFSPDVILADHSLPSFNSNEALLLFKETGKRIPFILVTAAMTDEFAVEMLEKGANDYVLKDRLGRLPGAIRNSLEKLMLEKKSGVLMNELQNNEKHYRALVENGADAIVILSLQGVPTYASSSIERVLGYSEFEVLQRTIYDVIHPDDKEGVAKKIAECVKGPGLPMEGHISRIKHKNGNWIWIEATLTNMLHNPAINGIVGNFRDITLRKLAEEKIIHVNRLYAFISQINKTIIHSQNEQVVFKEACRIAIELGKFKAAWIGMIDHDKNEITLVEAYGLIPEDALRFTNASCDTNGPQHQVLQRNSHYVCNNIHHDQELNYWKLFAIERGYNSLMVLPIRQAGIIVGTFNLYASEADFFNASEIELLEEATADISFSLEVFEKEKLRTHAEKKHVHNQLRLKQAQALAHVGSWERDFSTGVSIWSEEMLRIYGLPAGEINQSFGSWLSCIHPDDLDHVLRVTKEAEVNKTDPAFFHRIIRPDGSIRHIFSQAQPLFNNEGEQIGMYGAGHDVTDTRLAEEALRKSEVFNKGVLASLSSHIAVVDETGTIIAVNKAWDDFALENGTTSLSQTSTGSNYFEVCRKAMAGGDVIAGQALEGIQSVLRKETQSFDMEYSCHSPSQLRWYVLHVQSLGIDESKVVISHQDITEIKESQEALRNSQSNLQAIFKNSSEGFILTNIHGVIKSFNARAREFIYLNTENELDIGASIFDFTDVSRKQNLKDEISKVRAGETISYDHYFDGKNCKICWFNFIITPVYEKGQITAVCITISDITTRKQIEVSLKKSEFRYRQIVETAQEGIWMIDECNITTFANKKMCDILEYSMEEMLGKVDSFFLNDAGGHVATKARVGAKVGVAETVDVRFRTKSGRHIKAKVSTNPIFDEEGKYEGALAMVADITEKVMADEMLQESEQRYREIAYEMQLESARLVEAQSVAKVGSWELDLITFKLSWSDEMFRIFETDPRRFQISPAVTADFIHPHDRRRVQLAFEKSIDQATSDSIEYRIITPNGLIKHALNNWKIIQDEKGNSVSAMGACQDITERKKAEENDSFKANLLKRIGQAVIATDFNGSVNYWNSAAEKIYGWTTKEAIGKNIVDLTPSNQTQQQTNEIIELLKSGQTWTGEIKLMRKNGTEFPAYLTDSPIYDSENQLTGIIRISSDITEKKELEELLDKANSLARLGSWEVDLQKNTIYWSPITRQIHEVSNDFVPDLNAAIHFYKEGTSRKLMQEAVRQAMEKGTPWDLEVEVVTAKGNERWVRTLGESEFNNGECVKLSGSFQDIDVSRKAEIELLKVSEERNIILESITDGFYAVNKDWIITYLNKEAEILLGRKREEIVGKNLWEEYPEAVDSASYINYHKALEENTSQHYERYNATFRRWVEISAYPSPNGLSVFFRDITERKLSELHLKKLHSDLETYTKELVISNKEMEQFSYIVSHSLRAPVANIIGLAELLNDPSNNDETKAVLNTELTLSVKRLDCVIIDLNRILQIKNDITENREMVDLSELVNNIQSSIQNVIAEEKVIIKTDFSEINEFPTLRSYLHSIFYNLISNSIKYRQENLPPQIEIKSEMTDNNLIIKFKDNGTGIDLEKLGDQVFGLYKRFHKNIEGKGMGLFMVKTQVETLGGKISITSAINKGTEFRIEFKLNGHQ